MAWKQETGASGPIWHGVDSIYNPDAASLKPFFQFGAIILIVGALLFLLGSGCAGAIEEFRPGGARPGAGSGLSGVGIFMFVAGIASACASAFVPEWKNTSWTMTAKAGLLDYRGGEAWSAAVDTIASVEAGRTQEWVRGRPSGLSSWRPIPEHEWQTYLILADQSRRVVLTANADRETCVTLAASIRAHVEASRANVAARRPAPGNPAPMGEGFDL